jgi:glycolate oxidase FAD binding subunit
VLRPGGKVVKNVAGFDLVRLMTGAWGSLGAITRVSLRLRARPAVDETWRLAVSGPRAVEVQDLLRRGRTPPVACEIAPAGRLAVKEPDGLLVRLAGNAAFVAAARATLASFGDVAPADSALWLALRRGAPNRAPRTSLSPSVQALNEGVKRAFDPAGVLNPGIMG